MARLKRYHPVLRKNSRPHRLVEALALGTGVLIVSFLNPAAMPLLARRAIKGYLKKRRFERNILLRDLKHLQRRELVDFQEEGNGEVKIVLTQAGREKILRYNLDKITLTAPKRWDGKWRLIMFDIPQGQRMARDAFRRKLQELKFYAIQKSVYITPYPCEEEIDFIASLFEVRDHVLLFRVDHLEGAEKLEDYFHLK
ncbi:MAG: hypothetical protein Q8R13_00075 [bacterium]|nr:hypothetical protein [bacterium]MDZ4295876.1 hypothetical protein [Patescibacteria group bacterium]